MAAAAWGQWAATGLVLAGILTSGVSAALAADETAVTIRDITLKVPAEWKQEAPSNRMRLSQFVIPGADKDAGSAELVVSAFGGGGGGVDANLKRWIGEFEAEGRQSKVFTGKCPQGTYYLTDLTGTYNKRVGPIFAGKTTPVPGTRALGVILQVEGKEDNYFLKLTGPEATVTAAADAFRKSIDADASKETAYEPK